MRDQSNDLVSEKSLAISMPNVGLWCARRARHCDLNSLPRSKSSMLGRKTTTRPLQRHPQLHDQVPGQPRHRADHIVHAEIKCAGLAGLDREDAMAPHRE